MKLEKNLNCVISRKLSYGPVIVLEAWDKENKNKCFVVKLYKKDHKDWFYNEVMALERLDNDDDEEDSFFVGKVLNLGKLDKHLYYVTDCHSISFTDYLRISIPIEIFKLQLHMIARAVASCHR